MNTSAPITVIPGVYSKTTAPFKEGVVKTTKVVGISSQIMVICDVITAPSIDIFAITMDIMKFFTNGPGAFKVITISSFRTLIIPLNI